jgi:adenylate cyclase
MRAQGVSFRRDLSWRGVADPSGGHGDRSLGISALVALGETERAREWSQRALLMDPRNGTLTYNLACSMIELGEIDEAFALLDRLTRDFSPNMSIVSWWEKDSDLDPIRSDPRYAAWLETVKSRIATQAESVP